MKVHAVALLLVGLLVPVAIATGCGDDHPDVESNGTSDDPDAGGRSPGDAAAVVTDPGICDAVPQRSQAVAELALLGEPDAPLGGTLVPGTYVLNELRAYGSTTDAGYDPGPPAPTGHYARATLVVTAHAIRSLRADGSDPDALPADTQTAFQYTVSGTTLASTSACTSPTTQATGSYSANANYITFFPSANHVEVFVLRTF